MSKKKAKKQKEKFLRILTAKSLRLEWVAKSKNMDDNTLSEVLPNQSKRFLFSDEWKALRLEALKRYGNKCAKCGRPDSPKYPINVDHIKPRKYFPHLALDIDNLQPLCPPCNEEKGNRNKNDYRKVVTHVRSPSPAHTTKEEPRCPIQKNPNHSYLHPEV